jgi:hypothetical protein
MNAQDFLALLLPPTGFIFTATQAGTGWINTPHQSIQSAVAHVTKLTFENKQAYFALATYEKDKVWDASYKDTKSGEVVGKWRTRTQANAQNIRSFFLDLDVDQDDAQKFTSKDAAVRALIEFAKKTGLPCPMVVDSGGGIHAYWPLAQAVTTAEWRPVAETLKAICLHEQFHADRSLTSDQARVLRCLGGYNFRRDAPVKLLSDHAGPYAFDQIKTTLFNYATANGVSRGNTKPSGIAGVQAAGLGDNLGATNDPVHFDRIVFSCIQLGTQVALRGAGVGEKLWRAGLGIAKFSEPPDAAYRSISDGHAEYNEQATITKMDNWHTGPSTCAMFHQENPAVCEACPHWQKLTSPAQLGRLMREAPAPLIETADENGAVISVEAAPMPPNYIRRKDGAVVFVSEDKDGQPSYVPVSPYDLYPIKIMRQNSGDLSVDERSVWRAHLPRIGSVDMDMPQSLISDQKQLYAMLLSKGVYMNVDEAKATQKYMSAYLQTLAAQADREKLYEHLGWHDDHTAFVLGDRVLLRDGTVRPHNPSKTIRAVTKGGVVTGGTLDGWKAAMRFYNGPGCEGARFFLSAALGAPLFHMNDTGNKGVLLSANGPSGRGKTTCMKACASMWGVPEHLILNGSEDGTTVNAMYETLGTYHNLPFLMDEVTERNNDMLRKLLLNLSQGRGKERMKGTEHSGHSVSWATMMMITANTDMISNIISTGKDVDPHLMRLVSVEFGEIDASAEAKIVADNFLRAINQNYGHVGPLVMAFVTKHYDSVVKGYIKNVAMVDRMLNSANASAERYWSAAVAAAYTGAQIASKLGLIDFPYEDDLKWMVAHLSNQRLTIKESQESPTEFLTEFLERNLRNTLIVSAKASSNLDNIVHQPYGSLLVRRELDTNLVYVARSAMIEYCAEVKTPFRKMEQLLEAAGVILARNAQKVLGADTPLSTGQSRVWKIDASKLSIAPPVLQVVTIQPKVAAIAGGKS